MWAYSATNPNGYGAGYLTDPNNSVSTDPTYDPYAYGSSNYVSTNPTYNPYGGSASSSPWDNPGLWSAVIGGIGGYAESQSALAGQQEQAKLSAQAKLAIAQQQRQYKLDDRSINSGAVSNWTKYFGS